ncbi:unnamed protein product [Prorocentrum cordatum]|uniref:Uncharacterized protein n=1 Tax=Prorocentrum cordatum TaxID=2364126 RepID=A0ABN9R0R4_9DINO|nr:unnamed protein product [Polarella glacialis]
MVCWAWIMRISLSAMDYNRNPAPRTSFLMSRCLEAKDAMLMLNTYMETPLPFGYVHLISCLVNIQNIVMAVSTGFVVAQSLVDSQFYRIVEQVFALCVLTCLYQGILLISYVIADPLGDEELDS